LLIGSQSSGKAQEQTDPLQILRAGIQENEKKLLNVQVVGRILTEHWNKDAQKWEYSGESSVTAWYVGIPGSKVRIDYSKEVSRWTGGPAPFSEDTYCAAYNGRISQVLFTKVGSPMRPVTALRGEIDGNRARGLDKEFATGWPLSLYGIFENRGQRVSEMLSKAIQMGSKLRVTESTLNNVRCIQLVEHAGVLTTTWYFDPARNYAILGSELSQTNGLVLARWIVDKLLEPVPGVYYPVKVSSYGSTQTGEPAWRATYEASSVVANDPNFSDDIFTIKWPEGTVVQDKVSGTTFTVGASASETEKRIRDQVKEVKTALTNPPISQRVAARTPSAPKEGAGSARALRVAPVYFWGIGIVVVAGVLTLLLLFVTKGPRK